MTCRQKLHNRIKFHAASVSLCEPRSCVIDFKFHTSSVSLCNFKKLQIFAFAKFVYLCRDPSACFLANIIEIYLVVGRGFKY